MMGSEQMAFIDPAEADRLKKKITSDKSQLGKLYKSKKKAYEERNVEHNLVEDMLEKGWEEYGTPLKTKTKIRKPKRHNIKFEDDIWCQLYELGYRHFNYSNDFRLPYGKGEEEKKQIDVIAVNDDTILLVECKSSQRPRKPPSLKTEFEGLPRKLDGFKKSLEQIFGKGRKIKYVFATRNLRLDRDSTDIKRLSDTDSFFYNDNTYVYVNSLVQKYRGAAHYQVMAMLFRGKLINKEKIEVPAIEGSMGNRKYYMFSIEPHLLLKFGFVLHRTRANEAEMPTYQRLLVPNRLKGIGKFIEGGGFFPNSIVLNFSEQSNKLQFVGAAKGGDSSSRPGVLKIPNAYAIAYIIDGQHRVYGYAQSSFKDTNTIPVVAFCGLESSKQLELFMEINENQKAVSPTLRITLEEDLFWNSKRVDSRMKALRSSIIRELGTSITGPLRDKISIGEDKAPLSSKPFATAILRSGLLPQTKGNSYVPESVKASLYNTHNNDHSKEMSKARDSIVAFLGLCYQLVEEKFPELFEENGSFVMSNRGTYAFISLIGSLNTFETESGSVTTGTNFEARFRYIEKYLVALLEQLQKLPKQYESRLLGKLGSGADTVWFRIFQELVNLKFSEYEPSDLVDWKERQDGELQDQGRKLGIAIERHMKTTIVAQLKKLFGTNWDIEIGSIQRACETRAKEEMERVYKEKLGRIEIPWTDQFSISDYKTIIEKYWTKLPDPEPENFHTFEELFAINAGFGFNSKSEKLKWLSFFSSHRNNWAHEGTKEKGLNREEVNFLKTIHDHLFE